MTTPAVRERILALGGEALPLTPAQFGAKATEDSSASERFIKERQITGN